MVRRVLIPIAIAVAALLLAWRVCMPEIRCNRAWKLLNVAREDASTMSDYEAVVHVRHHVPAALPCIEHERRPNVFVMYEVAEAYRRMGRHDDAIAVLERSLRFDRRPEIYIALGDSLAQRGRVEEGLAMLMKAAHFYREEGRIIYMMRNTAYRDMVLERLYEPQR